MIEPLCLYCKRVHLGKGEVCDAYPGGIPEEILSGKVDHTRPYMGDNGLTFLDVLDGDIADGSAPLEEMRCAGHEGAAKARGPEDLSGTASYP
ncbi:hypothetical protein [Methanomassiliicoccus luminyensis]|uniref:hypothetical protein n=1 Tax=Methanomassiliicoccus luminyensis TaxID=1080712 RepID=UPI00035CB53F|nr:hypothetical protein [Methanomassiliicoccus luminyensis]